MLEYILLLVILIIVANWFFKNGLPLLGSIATITGGCIFGIICIGIIWGACMIHPVLGIFAILVFRTIGKNQGNE